MNNNLNIEEFNPKKSELIELADSCKDLVIKDVDDINGYELVNTKRKELKNARVQITKIGKSLRDNAIKFQREVIAREKEFVGIVAPVEKKLEDMINEHENRKVIKTIPMKKEWREKFEALQEARKEEGEAEKKRKSLHRIFWASVEEDTGIYQSMEVNDDMSEITVFED